MLPANCLKIAEVQLDTITAQTSGRNVLCAPEAQAQQTKALEGLADTSLVKGFPPLKWGKHTEKVVEVGFQKTPKTTKTRGVVWGFSVFVHCIN